MEGANSAEKACAIAGLTTPSSKYSITKQLAELDRQQKQAEQVLAEMTSSALCPSAPPASTVQPPLRKGKARKKK